MKTTTHSWALILIAVALAGAGVSYHFTLQSRFASIEQKLDQNTVALQQYQISQDTIFASKTEALNNLSKEVDTLQSSLDPLGKTTREENASLADIRKQIASLQQSQQAQQEAQKKLSDYANQIKHDILSQPAPAPVAPTPASTTDAPAPAPASAPDVLITTHASTGIPLPLPPRADNAIDLRPAQTTMGDRTPPRAEPVALPVALSAADYGN